MVMKMSNYRNVWVLVPTQVIINQDDNVVGRVIHPSLEELTRMAEIREYANYAEAIHICEQVGYLPEDETVEFIHKKKV